MEFILWYFVDLDRMCIVHIECLCEPQEEPMCAMLVDEYLVYLCKKFATRASCDRTIHISISFWFLFLVCGSLSKRNRKLRRANREQRRKYEQTEMINTK